MDITGYENIDFRFIANLGGQGRVYECGKCGGLVSSTQTHQNWHNKINKAMSILFNTLGMDFEGNTVKPIDKLIESLPYTNYF